MTTAKARALLIAIGLTKIEISGNSTGDICLDDGITGDGYVITPFLAGERCNIDLYRRGCTRELGSRANFRDAFRFVLQLIVMDRTTKAFTAP
jgi:hypothetical protein